jgi:hypothetical protein
MTFIHQCVNNCAEDSVDDVFRLGIGQLVGGSDVLDKAVAAMSICGPVPS